MTHLAFLPLFSLGQVFSSFLACRASPSLNSWSLQALTSTPPTPTAAVLSYCLQLTIISEPSVLASSLAFQFSPFSAAVSEAPRVWQELPGVSTYAFPFTLCPACPSPASLFYPLLCVRGLSVGVTRFWQAFPLKPADDSISASQHVEHAFPPWQTTAGATCGNGSLY